MGVAAFACVLAVGMSTSVAESASAATRLGGIDMMRVCATQNGSAWWVPYLTSQPGNAYSWRCWNDKYHASRGIDLNGGCRILYGNGAYALTGDTRSPYAWSCYR
ncbi:hypothetical protein AB0O90_12740 [Microbacterium testaceum]|uniref:hypothetical protein n=1 Tax=Microbacterium testaceum TaxID=2033 RepID=UPI0034206CB2